MEVRPGAVDVHGVRPRRRARGLVLAADQPGAGGTLSGGVPIGPDEDLGVHRRGLVGKRTGAAPADRLSQRTRRHPPRQLPSPNSAPTPVVSVWKVSSRKSPSCDASTLGL